MTTHNLWIVDSFTDQAFKGNPAGVHVVSSLPGVARMQDIASELNLSETAFVSPLETEMAGPDDGSKSFAIRYFSPKKEIPLCGHATLAASKVLFERTEVKRLSFQTAQRLELIVLRRGDQIEMTFPVYSVVDTSAPEPLLKALGISSVKFSGFNHETQILMLEIDSADSVSELTPDYSALVESCDSISGVPIHGVSVTAKANDGFDFHSRYFWPWSGGMEDPVTGSTHTFLAKYWSGKLGKSILRSFQSSQRTGQMEVELTSTGRLLIRGQAVIVLEGNLNKGLMNE